MAHGYYGNLSDPTNLYHIAQLYQALSGVDFCFRNFQCDQIPSLAYWIDMANRYAKTLAFYNEGAYLDPVGLSLRPTADGKMNREPRIHADKEIALSARGIPGPWYLAEVKEEVWDIMKAEMGSTYNTA